MIACVYIPDIVSVVENTCAEGKHVILMNPMGNVQAASLVAVQRGVRIGMRRSQAHALIPDAEVRQFEQAPYQEITETIEAIVRDFTVRFELVSGFWMIGKRKSKDINVKHPSAVILYLDLGKLGRTAALEVAKNIRDTLRMQLGVVTCIGLASGKFPAAVAARSAKLEHTNSIPLGREKEFLSRFPVTLLPLDKETSRRLPLLGIRTLGKFADLPAASVFAQFGKYGRFLHQLASGYDNRTIAYNPPKPVERLSRCFNGAIENREWLLTILEQIGCELAARLAVQGYVTQSLTLVIHLEEGKPAKVTHTMREAIGDGKVIGRRLIRLFSQVELACGVISFEVIANELSPVQMQQLELFPSVDLLHQNRLTNLLTDLAIRHGNDSLFQIIAADDSDLLLESRFHIELVDVA